jgi:glutamine amidotransferase
MTNAARPRIAVLDYGMGNRRSVEKALERVGARPEITNDHDLIRTCDGMVLPGVGAFPRAMRNLRELELDRLIGERLADGVPTLGICLGMQLLFEASSEGEGTWGLGLLSGRVDRLPAAGLKVPHIGWTPVTWTKRSALIETSEQDVLGTARYGERFVCAVEREPLYGVQFHPEKSSTSGLRLLENFGRICAS